MLAVLVRGTMERGWQGSGAMPPCRLGGSSQARTHGGDTRVAGATSTVTRACTASCLGGCRGHRPPSPWALLDEG